MRHPPRSLRAVRPQSLARRNGVQENFEFFDTYNPRNNPLQEKHDPYPTIILSRGFADMKSYRVRHPHWETRAGDLLEYPPVFPLS